MSRRLTLSFHGIGVAQRPMEPDEDRYWISVEFFDEIVEHAARNPEALEFTFDDGNASDVEIALPRLAEHGIKGRFFPVARRIGQPGSVDAAGLQALRKHGMSIGSHGLCHRPWRTLTASELAEELIDARRVIQNAAGVFVDTAACPFGSYDRRVLGELRALEYRQVFTSDECTARRGAWLRPRFAIRKSQSLSDIVRLTRRRGMTVRDLTSAARTTVKRLR